MKRILAAVLACAALEVPAFEYCDVVGKPAEMMRDAKGWHRALEQKDYAALESAFGSLLAEVEDGKAGDGKAERAFRAFEKVDEWRDARHRDWQRAFPRSAAALVARSHYHLGRAFSLGAGYGPRDEERDAVMRAELAIAREMVGRADRVLRSRTLTDALRIRIAAADDGPRAAHALAMESGARDADSLAAWMARVDANGERWGGRREDLAAVPRQASALPAADRRYLEYMVESELGRSDLASARPSAAMRHFARAEPLCPALSFAASELAKLYLERHDYRSVLPIGDRLVKGYPSDGVGYLYRGRANRGLRRYGEAFNDLARAVELGRNEAFGELAWFHETGTGTPGDLAKALELYAVAEARDIPGGREGAKRVRAKIRGQTPG